MNDTTPPTDLVAHGQGLMAMLVGLATTIAVSIGGALQFNSRVSTAEKRALAAEEGIQRLERALDEERDKRADAAKAIREEIRAALERRSKPSLSESEIRGLVLDELRQVDIRIADIHHDVTILIGHLRGIDGLGSSPGSRGRR